MDLRVLSYFLTVAEEENMTRAANLLHITQPTLSRQLKQLEDELGVLLFERKSHRITLTREGHHLKRRAREILSLVEKTKSEFQKETLKGEISIGSGDFLASDYLTEAVAAFQAQNPDVSFRIYTGNADDVKDLISDGSLDFGLLVEPVDKERYTYIDIPLIETFVCLIPEGHPLASREKIRSEDLIDEPLYLPERKNVSDEMIHWTGKDPESLKIRGYVNLQYNLSSIVRNGAGLGLSLALKASYDGVVTRPLDPPLLSHTVFAWKKGQSQSPVTRAFIDFFREYRARIIKDAEEAFE